VRAWIRRALAYGSDITNREALTPGFPGVFGTMTIARPSITTIGDQNYLKEMTLAVPAVALRGAVVTFGAAISGSLTSLDLDFDDGVTFCRPRPRSVTAARSRRATGSCLAA